MAEQSPRAGGLQRALDAAIVLEAEGRTAPEPAAPPSNQAPEAREPCVRALSLAAAEPCATALLEYMRAAHHVERVELAGALRRRCEHVASIDILAVSAHPERVRRHFAEWPAAEDVFLGDPTHASLLTPSGLRAELRIVPRRCFGTALQYLTGSTAHNTALRRYGLERDVRLSEYGVFRLDHARPGARRSGGQREEDAYEVLGLQWIPPELREDTGEIQAAEQHLLPSLVEPSDILGDLRVTPRQSGGYEAAVALVHGCLERGYAYCGIAAPTPGGGRRRDHEQFRRLADAFPAIDVRLAIHAMVAADGSAEFDLPPGDDDVIIACVPRRLRGRPAMAERLLRALDRHRIDIIEAASWSSGMAGAATDPEVAHLLAEVAARGVALEVSGRPGSPNVPEPVLRQAAALGVTLSLTSGARTAADLRHVRYAIDRARRAWVAADQVINAQPLGARMQGAAPT